MQAFSRVNVTAVLQWLKDLGNRLDQLSTAAELAADLPFTENLKLNEVADFASDLPNAGPRPADQRGRHAELPHAQELIDLLAGFRGRSSGAGYRLRPRTKELTFSLNFGKTFDDRSAPGPERRHSAPGRPPARQPAAAAHRHRLAAGWSSASTWRSWPTSANSRPKRL